MALEFVDKLPQEAPHVRATKYLEEAQELREHPAVWAVFKDLSVEKAPKGSKTSDALRASGVAGGIRAGSYKAFVPDENGHFEAASRGTKVYVRYVPKTSD